MDFGEQVKAFSARIPSLVTQVKTEEGTKTAFILPFIQMLGYNVFEPSEVCPECIADCGTKKGEKVDYAIMQDGKPVILVECKAVDVDLSDTTHLSQLYRYFSVTEASVGILTNGIIYQFYADIDAQNKMDSKPFLEINMLNVADVHISALTGFRKGSFNVDAILPSAIEMKYTREIKRILGEQLETPDGEFVRYFARQITHSKLTNKTVDEIAPVGKRRSRLTDKKVDKIAPIVKRALNQFINDKINDRLQSAMTPQEKPVPGSVQETVDQEEEKIVATEEEIKGFYIVQAILSDVIDPSRVVMRDVQSYFGVLLDDTNRKPICRMYLNSPTKKCYLGLFDGDKEDKTAIEGILDIYKYKDRLRKTIDKYQK